MDVTVVASAFDHFHSGRHPLVDASGNVFERSNVDGYRSASLPEDRNRFYQVSLVKYCSDRMKLWGEKSGNINAGPIISQNREGYL